MKLIYKLFFIIPIIIVVIGLIIIFFKKEEKFKYNTKSTGKKISEYKNVFDDKGIINTLPNNSYLNYNMCGNNCNNNEIDDKGIINVFLEDDDLQFKPYINQKDIYKFNKQKYIESGRVRNKKKEYHDNMIV